MSIWFWWFNRSQMYSWTRNSLWLMFTTSILSLIHSFLNSSLFQTRLMLNNRSMQHIFFATLCDLLINNDDHYYWIKMLIDFKHKHLHKWTILMMMSARKCETQYQACFLETTSRKIYYMMMTSFMVKSVCLKISLTLKRQKC